MKQSKSKTKAKTTTKQKRQKHNKQKRVNLSFVRMKRFVLLSFTEMLCYK